MKIILVFLILIFVSPFFSAAHYIVGVANNAIDGRNANDLEVFLWNPLNGISDNLTDVIGSNGNSGVNNYYMIDCELLNTPCNIGDNLSMRVFSYPFSEIVNVSVTGAGFDIAPNITLNSLPNTTLISPFDYSNISLSPINFNCSYLDNDSNVKNVSLYGNWSGGWHLNETKDVSGIRGSILFTKNLEEGIYKWGCSVADNLSVETFSENNFTLTVDRTSPVISSVSINETYLCGTSSNVRVICNTTDNFGIENVFIEAQMPNGTKTNYSTEILLEDSYYKDILLGDLGGWKFNCISIDYANNSANLSTDLFEVYSVLPDLVIYPEINFSNYFPIEGESINISSIILNKGCADANNFLVGFYNGDPSLGNQIGSNKTVSVLGLENSSTNISWNAVVGPTNVYIFADVNNSISEYNESNNKFNSTFDVESWQEFYGNVSGIKTLSDNILNNISLWNMDGNMQGNIFMADVENDIDWSSLVAIGKDKFGINTTDDFSEIDSFLSTSNFNDSVRNIFTNDGVPYSTKNFSIDGKVVSNVPIVNSTNNTNFITGILWDSSDDSDNEYGSVDKEDIVFVAKLNKASPGKYGIYDYELRVPVRLRNYDSATTQDIYLYYDLV